ncbi:class I SAM-dependent methyltransferase [Streptomyces yaizuensis]|uniref:Class I SAM-dependent methyltransferase n=1 Tax=Streptomyces yaizuensis TaxID=2989713 RepID=A0ABQ5P6V1_9ACTN|nr:class I SAM-dependent methyltransferase [Streptomyces sp. YSPA8]GLF98302.1 class I SAM-dependent methyltransferase [Streptomyces sp. YSPA8]
MTHDHDHSLLDWDEMTPLLERGAELETPLYRRAADWMGELLPVPAVRRVVDFGSGPGVLTAVLAEAFPYASLVAVDPTPQLLERAADRARHGGYGDRFESRHAELPLRPGQRDDLGGADLVWAGNVVHHVGDQRAALAELGGLLRPGGLLAVVEGGLPSRALPRDLGMGRPGLEARIDAAHAEWFQKMRDALPGATATTEDWRTLLTDAGLAPAGTRSFLLDIPAPVPAVVREHLVHVFTRQREVMGGLLAADDIAVLDRLLDPEDPQGLFLRPDLYQLSVRTVHLARR